MISNETVNDLIKKGGSGILCKLDMEKAFDNVSWDFIDYLLNRFGFRAKGRQWIRACISNTSFAVPINGDPSSFFKTSKGLRQGDPGSPLLFILVMESLNKLIEQAKQAKLLSGFVVGRGSKQLDITHLFFVNDTLIFCRPEPNMLFHLRCILLWLQAVSGLKINMLKSEMVGIGVGSAAPFAQVLGCKSNQLPIKYFEIPLDAKYKDGKTWDPIIDLFEGRLARWKRRFLSKGGRLTLIKNTLANLPTYFLSMLTIPTKFAKRLEKNQCNFLWSDDESKRRFHLVNWDKVKTSTKAGGLGLRSLGTLNTTLHGK